MGAAVTGREVRDRLVRVCGGTGPEDPTVTLKLGDPLDQGLDLGATPAGYGLGRSGWVTARCSIVPAGVLEDWLEESYRLVAPERLVALLDAIRTPTPPATSR